MDRFILTTKQEKIGKLKFKLLSLGMTISKSAESYLQDSKYPIRTRSGSSGGLDIVLPFNIHVNVPILEPFANKSSLSLILLNDGLAITDEGVPISSVQLQPTPKYYSKFTSDGVPMKKVGQMCSGDRFCYGMTGSSCRFWSTKYRCRYCSIGLNNESESNNKKISQLLETLEYAINDENIPAKHILLGGGTPPHDDMGAILAADLCIEIKKRFSIGCYVMISAPLDNKYIDLLKDAGVDELGINLEFFHDDSWREFIPGKNEIIGKERYLKALEYSVKVFGPINTRSILIVGLEDEKYSVEGADLLASMGVMPILSPFRPLKGSDLEKHAPFNYQNSWNLISQIQEKISKYQIPIGPTCIPCQNNTLTLPFPENDYRFYQFIFYLRDKKYGVI